MTADCQCCLDIGWTSTDTWFSCRGDHTETFDFNGYVMVACPHCNDTTPYVPLAAERTVEQTLATYARLADMALAGKVDALGIHHGAIRQQRALDRLERVLGLPTGHFAGVTADPPAHVDQVAA